MSPVKVISQQPHGFYRGGQLRQTSYGSAINALLRLLSILSFCAVANAQDGIDVRYLMRQGAITLGANPLTPAARTAFYTARGFSAAAIRPYAEACAFSFGMQNDGTKPMTAKLADWRAIGADGRKIAFKPPEAWEAQWEKIGVPQAARIAFRWAQFQAENTFEPGDWIMGMATLESVPTAPFRLIARYHDNKGDHEIALEKLECARD